MSKEVSILAWCDLCDAEHTRTPATEIRSFGITDGEERPKILTVDLCESCAKSVGEILAPLLERGVPLAVKGRPPLAASPSAPGKVRASEPAPCPICGAPFRRSSLVSHLWARHGKGVTRPRPGNQCPECSYVADSPQGIGAHRSITHRYDPIAEAVALITAATAARGPRKAGAK